MKNFYLSLLVAICCLPASATHLMGGEITIQDLNNGQHQVTMLVYRDTIGIPMAQYATFSFDGPNGQSFLATTGYDSIISGNLLPMYPYGVEIYLFIDTVTFPSAGLWDVSWWDCCRNAAIQNLANPLGDRMVLKTSLMVDSIAPNSTPFFLVPAAIFLPLNTAWQYNPLPFDPDGDSLSWRIDTPLAQVNQYCFGYIEPAADPANPFTIDPVTGTISWTANTMGNFVASVLVDQYRNGQWVGHIRRDMQFIVVNAGQGIPQWRGLATVPKDQQGHFALDLVAGQQFNLSVWAGHSDSSRVNDLQMGAFSEVLLDPANKAEFKVIRPSGMPEINGVFSWTPKTAHIRAQSYLVTLRIADGFFTDDRTFKLNVNTAVGQRELNSAAQVSLYPNPAQNYCVIEQTASRSGNLKVGFYDIAGKLMQPVGVWKQERGANQLIIDLSHFQSGIYILRMTDDLGYVSSRSLAIQR